MAGERDAWWGKSSGFGGSRLPPAPPTVVAEETERGEDLGGAEVGGLAEHGADEVGAVVVGESGDAARRRVREAAELREPKRTSYSPRLAALEPTREATTA